MKWSSMTYASPRTAAPARTARNGTAPQSAAATGAYDGFDNVWVMYRYPTVPVKMPMTVELNVRRSLMRVSDVSPVQFTLGKKTHSRAACRPFAFLPVRPLSEHWARTPHR